MIKKTTCIIFFLIFSQITLAKNFLAPYVTFHIGDNWSCESFGVDWVCHHYLHDKAIPSLILVMAKEGVPSDNLNFYVNTFPKDQYPFVKIQNINGQKWVDTFFKKKYTVIKNMFDRYVATVCCDNTQEKIHVFTSFHVHSSNYDKYSNMFLRSIKSLKLVYDMRQALLQIKKQTKQQQKDMNDHISNIWLKNQKQNQKTSFSFLKNKNSQFIFYACGLIFFILVIMSFLQHSKKKKIRQKQKRRRR